MREIVHIQAGQCGNQIGAKVRNGSCGCCCSQVKTCRILNFKMNKDKDTRLVKFLMQTD